MLPLEHLEQVQAASAEFAAAAFRALGGTGATTGSASALDAAGFAATHARILAPAEEALLQYGDRELAYLTAELARIGGRGALRSWRWAGAAAVGSSV